MKTPLMVLFLCVTLQAHADLVVSLRYFMTEDTSHHHLYLYRDDGKVVRQLTSPEDAHDTSPIFSTDGSTIVFTREAKGGSKIMSIQPDGGTLRTLSQAPAWYVPSGKIDAYGSAQDGKLVSPWKVRANEQAVTVPGGKIEVALRNEDRFKDPDSGVTTNAFKALTIRNTADKDETRVPTLTDTEGNFCYLVFYKNSPFLLRDGLRVLLYEHHLNSTDGDELGALDLDRKKAVSLSANPAIAIPHGTRSGFFCVSQDRYQPLPGTTKSVNCIYLDWWDAELKRTRFAKAASLFGGASVRVKGQPQLDIPRQPQPK